MTDNARSTWLSTNRFSWSLDVLEDHTDVADILEQFHKATRQENTLLAAPSDGLTRHDSSITVENLNNYWSCFPDLEMR